jgi:hypothetical protein
MDNPESLIYTYSLWIYAKTINKNGGKTNIFYYGSDIRLDITSDSQLKFYNETITEYFPLEQWVFVVICANKNSVYDFYLDGKLVKSLQINGSPTLPTNKELIIGNNTGAVVDIRLANFKRIPKVRTHYEVQVEYEKNKYIKDYYKSPKYNLEISLKNKKTNEKTYSLYRREQHI